MLEDFSVETVSHASYLVNMSLSTAVDLQIPKEIWRGELVDYSTVWIFGCLTYNLVNSQKRNKLESNSKRCYFIDFIKVTKAYRLWDLEKNNTFVSRDMVFNEFNNVRKVKDRGQDTRWIFRRFSKFSERGVWVFTWSHQACRSNVDSSASDGDKHEATQEQHM